MCEKPLKKKTLTKKSRLSSINLNEDKILKIIRVRNIQKAHGHYNISIRMIKIAKNHF